MKNWMGRWLCVAAVIHVLAATAQYHRVLYSIWQMGVFNTVAGNPIAGAVVWSLLFGAVAFIGGLAVNALEKSGGELPKSLGWCLLALAAIGIILVPVSGFWLVFPPAISILLRKSAARAR